MPKAKTKKHKDTRRLNWLEENDAHLISYHETWCVDDPECEYAIFWRVVKDNVSLSGHPLGSARAAIDAAMKAQAKVPTGATP